MFKISCLVKKYQTKNGQDFYKATCKGQYLPILECDPDTYYTIKLVNLPAFNKEGIFDIGMDSNRDMWLDSREGFAEKNIVRVKAKKVLFVRTVR